MAARNTFGKTWWGNAWIEAMGRIDYNTNRLPRGRRYANNGSVRTIDIKNSEVIAKVQGSRPKPYDIKISLVKYNDSQAKDIKEAISSNPAVASELGIGRLPESLLSLLEAKKIYLLPHDWKDMTASCSCPDWANPCKHLAAVYYIIANEIDKDPFILFNLRGLKAGELTETAGLTAANVPAVRTQRPEVFIPYKDIVIPKTSEVTSDDQIRELPDLSFAPFDIVSIFSLLPDNPLFYPGGDLKKTLLQAYKALQKAVDSIGIDEGNDISFSDTDFYLSYDDGKCSFFITPPHERFKDSKAASLSIPLISKGKLTLKKTKGVETGLDEVVDLFSSLPFDAGIDSHSTSSRFMNAAVSVALSFIRSFSFVPEIDLLPDAGFRIRYAPLINDDKHKAAVDYLKGLFPFNICVRKKDGGLMTKDGVTEILSVIITDIFHRRSQVEKKVGDKVYSAFFAEKDYKAERFEERQTAKTVSDWLERVHIRGRDISPVIKIETVKDDFSVAIEVENKKDPLAKTIPLSKIFGSKGDIFSMPGAAVRTDVARQITIAGDYMPPLKEILNGKGLKEVVITPSQMADFMTGASNVLSVLGINTIIPKELKRLAMPRLAIKASKKGKGETVSYLSLYEMLDFSWEVAIGDKTISAKEFLKLAKSANGIVKFKDQYILLKPEEVKNILDRLNKPLPSLSSMDMLHSAFTGEVEGMLFSPDDAVKRVLDELTHIEEINIPDSLTAQLRPYQERGFRWLYSNTVKGFGSCIADDMGLGKTIQVISLILRLKEDKRLGHPALVICPTTLVGNWQKECERFAPSLEVSLYHGMERSLALKGKDVVVTTYGILRRDLDKFKGKEWGMVVIDEAQNIKNPDTDQTKAVKSIKAGSCIAMSGTPVENRLTELWSIFDFINRGYLGQMKRFKEKYAMPVEKYRDKECIEKLRKATAPFMLRRLKTDKTIISDLPDKIMFNEYCYLSKEQTALYQKVVDTTIKEIEQSEGIERKGLIFKLITALKQICNHPVHFSKKGNPQKELSGKSEKAIDLIGNILAAKEKAIIFTQYKEMGELLAEMIKNELKEDALFFHGGITRPKRDKMVEAFQTDKATRLMIISLKAGGTGLNLTAASNVIHYDLWWNPAVEAQATDRAYRIGQDKNVMVHRLITLSTFEEKIDEMIQRKKELADLTVATGEQWITELSNTELKEIFGLVNDYAR